MALKMKSRWCAALLLCLPVSSLAQELGDFDFFSLLDVNHDAGLTQDELAQLYPNLDQALFTAADQNADGQLSVQEFMNLFSGITLEEQPDVNYELRLPDLPQVQGPGQTQNQVRAPQAPVVPNVSGPTPPVINFLVPNP